MTVTYYPERNVGVWYVPQGTDEKGYTLPYKKCEKEFTSKKSFLRFTTRKGMNAVLDFTNQELENELCRVQLNDPKAKKH